MPDLLEANRAINAVYETVGARIAMVRKAQGLTQGNVATSVGMTRASIANAESGRQRLPLHVYLTIAQGFGLTLDELLGDAVLPSLADQLPHFGAVAVKQTRAALLETAEELMRVAAKLEAFDA